jgi:cytosine/adenosine deaminase-related metal-dependent hydrolase
MKKAIINAMIYDFDKFIDNGFIIFDENVIDLGHMNDFIDKEYKIIDGKDHLVMPNLVCGHTHIYSTFSRGMTVPFNPHNFQDVLDQLWWKLDRHLDNQMTYYSGIVSAVDFVKNGVTTLIDHHASGTDIIGSLDSLKNAVCDKVGLRGIFAFEVSDRFNVDQAIEENIQFIKNNNTPFTKGLFGLHASMSLSEATLKKVKQQIENYPIHIHVAESELDEQDSYDKFGKSILQRLDDHELINKNSILVHAIYVNDDELNIIKNKGGVIAVNFSSNMNNAVGLPNLAKFKQHNIPVIIGNDGISSAMSNEYLNLYYSTHLKDGKMTKFTLNDLVTMINATYRYTGELLGINIGKLQSSYCADLMMIPYIPPTPINRDNAFGHLFFGLFHSLKPRHVFVGGNQLVTDFELTNKHLLKEYRQADKYANKLWVKIDGEDK